MCAHSRVRIGACVYGRVRIGACVCTVGVGACSHNRLRGVCL